MHSPSGPKSRTYQLRPRQDCRHHVVPSANCLPLRGASYAILGRPGCVFGCPGVSPRIPARPTPDKTAVCRVYQAAPMPYSACGWKAKEEMFPPCTPVGATAQINVLADSFRGSLHISLQVAPAESWLNHQLVPTTSLRACVQVKQRAGQAAYWTQASGRPWVLSWQSRKTSYKDNLHVGGPSIKGTSKTAARLLVHFVETINV
eukprot:364943-Chlamydomonas_euryale.AAC.26